MASEDVLYLLGQRIKEAYVNLEETKDNIAYYENELVKANELKGKQQVRLDSAHSMLNNFILGSTEDE